MDQPESRSVKSNGKPTYRDVADRFSPGFHQAFLDFSLSAGLSENDSIHWVLKAQADLYESQITVLLDEIRAGNGTNGQGKSPELTPDQLEQALTRALQKRRDDVAVLSALDQMPRLVGNHVDALLQERLEQLRRDVTSEKEGEGRRWPAWVRKILAFVTDRWFIAITCFVIGALPFLLLHVQSEKQRADEANGRVAAMVDRLPSLIRLQLTGNITYSEPANGKPARVLLNFGQKFRPVKTELTSDGEVSVVFAP